MKPAMIRVSSPGRVCLFGEHQDYLGLDVIAAAINLRIFIEGRPRGDRYFYLDLPDTKEKDCFLPEGQLPYLKPRDYLRSSVNVLLRLGCHFDTGWNIRLTGQIPINAGTSSSSAMVVAWMKFLLEASDCNHLAPSPEKVAELSHRAEVLEFNEPGGQMDHFTSARGGLLWIRFEPEFKLTSLQSPIGTFVLGDSLTKKDTTGTLGSVRQRVRQGLEMLKKENPLFDLKKITENEIRHLIKRLPPELGQPLLGAVLNRDLTGEGLKVLTARPFDEKEFGRLLLAEQDILRDLLRISTPRIDLLLKTALEHGALGGKINGSGGGGCLFVYAPHEPEKVARAIEESGGKPYIIAVDSGLSSEKEFC
ncbi:MAG TPA: galactokinase family protein [Candidatus Saccharicenans sp.]|nr:galactokinase family protein [Candidatus Saccharicenans sp.]